MPHAPLCPSTDIQTALARSASAPLAPEAPRGSACPSPLPSSPPRAAMSSLSPSPTAGSILPAGHRSSCLLKSQALSSCSFLPVSFSIPRPSIITVATEKQTHLSCRSHSTGCSGSSACPQSTLTAQFRACCRLLPVGVLPFPYAWESLAPPKLFWETRNSTTASPGPQGTKLRAKISDPNQSQGPKAGVMCPGHTKHPSLPGSRGLPLAGDL